MVLEQGIIMFKSPGKKEKFPTKNPVFSLSEYPEGKKHHGGKIFCRDYRALLV